MRMLDQPAPDFTLTDTAGQPYQLSTAWANGPAILVFYPGDFTPVCTRQLCDYRDRHGDFARISATVLGINPGTVGKHQEFAAHHGFPFTLLSDPTNACSKAYGAAAWYGTRRLVVVIDQKGSVRYHHAVLPFLRQSADELLKAAQMVYSDSR